MHKYSLIFASPLRIFQISNKKHIPRVYHSKSELRFKLQYFVCVTNYKTPIQLHIFAKVRETKVNGFPVSQEGNSKFQQEIWYMESQNNILRYKIRIKSQRKNVKRKKTQKFYIIKEYFQIKLILFYILFSLI